MPSSGPPSTSGDPLASLVRSCRASLCRAARAEGLGPEDAFDCAQEAFVVLLSAPDPPAPGRARGFLIATARNLARNRRRSRSLVRPHLGPDALDALGADQPDADALLLEAERRGHLLACVHRLERLQRAVVTLRMLDERPGESVAAQLGLSPGHAAVLLHRAKLALRRCLEAASAPLDGYPLTTPRRLAVRGLSCLECIENPYKRRARAMDAIVDEVSFEQRVRGAPAVLVDFGSQWCPPCRRLEAVIAELQASPTGALRGLPVLKIDVDQLPGLQRRFAVRALPTLVLFRAGQPVKSRVGATSAASLASWLGEALGG